jgi:hypothetical protein
MFGEFLIPGWGVDGQLKQLHRYVMINGKRRLLATPGLSLCLHAPLADALGVEQGLIDPRKSDLYVCEGIFDGMALWEAMKAAEESGYDPAVHANILAVPSCNVFHDGWLGLFSGRRVFLMYDNDHPRTLENGKTVPPAGHEAMKRVTNLLFSTTVKPAISKDGFPEVFYLNWGKDGYDAELASGYDVRDFLKDKRWTGVVNEESRVAALQVLIDRMQRVPKEWTTVPDKKVLYPLACTEWKTLRTAWVKALKWTPGLDTSLACMLASVASVRMPGDQLWIKVIGPPASGKSTLCEALAVNSKYIFSKSTIKGFHSGYRSDKEGTEDHSLIVKIKDKTLVTKDGDTLLTLPNLPQVLAEARDLYDTTSRAHYRVGMSRDYQGIRMTWILCGTDSLRQLDSSELGERFLDVVLMDSIDEELEEEIGWRAVNRIIENRAIEANGQAEDHQDAAMTQAMRLTGGYIDFLRVNASKLLSEVKMSEDAARECMRLGKFVAYMRARPSKKQDESATREMSTRLRIQLTRLALCLAIVLNKPSVDSEVLARLRKVALDTARGRTFEACKHMHKAGEDGRETRALAVLLSESAEKVTGLLVFLKRIGVVEIFSRTLGPGVRGGARWRLTESVKKIMEHVLEAKE